MFYISIGDIYGNNQILYYPADPHCVILEATLSLQVGSAGEFDFVVPTLNPEYAKIKQGAIVTIMRDDKEFWRGEVQDTTKDLYGNLSVYCLEDLAWLGQEFMIPTKKTNETYLQRFQSALAAYNENQTEERKFKVGYITNVDTDDRCNWSTQYEWSILDSIRECIAKSNGYLRVRRQTDGRYIDVVKLSDYGIMAEQTIRFGENLLDYVEEMNMGNLTNVLYSYGGETEEALYDDVNKRIVGPVLSDDASIEMYGRHARAVIFETDSEKTLDSLAKAYISRYAQPQLRFELSAIDLADIGSETHFNLGDSIRVIAEPFGIDQWIYLTDLELDLLDVSKNNFTLSSHITRGRTLTEQTIGTQEAIDDIPSKASFLDAARKNALELLNGTNGGYVTFETNEDGQIIELQIANNLDKTQATQMWQWNLGGLGYKTRKTPQDEWIVLDAMTMDGAIVANRITSGTLKGIRIEAEEGLIAGFEIKTDKLKKNDAIVSADVLACGSAGSGMVNIVGNRERYNDEHYGYIQISNDGDTNRPVDGIRIYGTGKVERYDGYGNKTWTKWLSNVPNE